MTTPPGDHNRPGVYARLAEEAEIRQVRHAPPPSVRWLGWALCVALCAVALFGALQANPW